MVRGVRQMEDIGEVHPSLLNIPTFFPVEGVKWNDYKAYKIIHAIRNIRESTEEFQDFLRTTIRVKSLLASYFYIGIDAVGCARPT